MKVIVDVIAVQQPLTGVGRYEHRLAKGLENSSAVNEIKFFSTLGWLENFDYPNEQPNAGIKAPSTMSNIKSILRKNALVERMARKGFHTYRNRQFSTPHFRLRGFYFSWPQFSVDALFR